MTGFYSSRADMLRGHVFLPEDDELARVPKLYATEKTKTADKVIHIHWFSAVTDFYVAEIDLDEDLVFGFAHLGSDVDAEWGYQSISELRTLYVAYPGRFPVIIERDLHWQPTRFGDINI